MSTKPTIALARWGDQISANLVAPTSGERDLGFLAGTPAASGKYNYEVNQLYLWALYLNDGALSGNHSIAGTLSTTGLITASGGVTVPTGQAVTLSGTTSLSVGGSATVTGALAVNGGATVPFGQTLTSSGTTTLNDILFLGRGTLTLATGNNNNVAFPGPPVVAVSATGSPVLTGVIPPSLSQTSLMVLAMPTGPSIQVTHQDTNSSPSTNRFILPGGATLTIAQGQIAAFLWGANGTGAWFLLCKNF